MYRYRFSCWQEIAQRHHRELSVHEVKTSLFSGFKPYQTISCQLVLSRWGDLLRRMKQIWIFYQHLQESFDPNLFQVTFCLVYLVAEWISFSFLLVIPSSSFWRVLHSQR